MAWTHAQSAGEITGSGTSANVSFGVAVGSGDVVCGLFITASGSGGTPSSVTDDKSNSYTIVDSIIAGPSGLSSWSFWGGPFTNGPTTITVTMSVTQALLWILIDEFSPGGSGTAVLDGHNAGTNNTPNPTSGNFTTAVNG